MTPSADGTPSHEDIISSHSKQMHEPSTYIQWLHTGEGTATGCSSIPVLPCRLQDPTNKSTLYVDYTMPAPKYATLAVMGSGQGMGLEMNPGPAAMAQIEGHNE